MSEMRNLSKLDFHIFLVRARSVYQLTFVAFVVLNNFFGLIGYLKKSPATRTWGQTLKTLLVFLRRLNVLK